MSVPIHIRPLTLPDIPNLPDIRPTYQTETILQLVQRGTGIRSGWALVEVNTPYDKGGLYDFIPAVQADIRARFSDADQTFQRIAEDTQRGCLVGLLDVHIQTWNNTAFIWNLMIDHAYRRQGLGRRLWGEAVRFARQRGVRALTLETQNTNLAACRFYEAMGCALVGFNTLYYTNNPTKGEFALFWAFSQLFEADPAP